MSFAFTCLPQLASLCRCDLLLVAYGIDISTFAARFFQCNPSNPSWVNRDRFVLSNGHACALQYVLLHLLGYKVSIDDLKQVRRAFRSR